MDPLTLGLIGSAVAPVVGGVVGNLMGKGDRDKAAAIYAKLMNDSQNLSLPEIEQMQIQLEKYKEAGAFTPEMEAAISQGDSETAKIDPRLKNTQYDILNKLSGMSSGVDDISVMEQNNARRAMGQDVASNNASILSKAAQMGTLDSGNTLAAQLMGSQASANRASQESDRALAMAYQRKMDATMNTGQMAGQMRNQDTDVAKAQDEINRFNAANRQGVASRNVGSANDAQRRIWENKQDILNKNTGVGNQQEIHNKGLHQQNFNNKIAKQGLVNTAAGGQAALLTGQAQASQNMGVGIGAGVGQGVGAAAAAQKSDYSKWLEEDKAGSDADYQRYLRSTGKKK